MADNATPSKAFPKHLLKPKHWPTWIGLGLIFAVVHLPYRWQLNIGKGIGLLAYRLAASRRRIADVNIRLCFPEKSEAEREALARQTFIDNGIGLIETMMAWFREPDYMLKNTEFSGFEAVKAHQAEGRGVMLLGAHYPMMDLIGALVSNIQDVVISYRHQDNEVVNYLMESRRQRIYQDCITRKDVRGFIRTLRKGQVLWYAPDQDLGRKNSVFVDFFGVPAATTNATSRIVKAGKAVVMPINMYRKADNSGYVVEVSDPLAIPSGDDAEDARLCNEVLEKHIRQHPAQYLWLHKRFKTPVNPEEKKGLLYKK